MYLNSHKFSPAIKETNKLVIPTICIYEISKVILRESDENHLLQVLAAIQKGKIIELTPSLSTFAAKISLQHKLPMADSIIYATARHFNATVWTQDIDFKNLANVNYIPKIKC